MPLRIDCRANDSDKHEFDINHLLFHKGILYSGADDGKIKAWSPDLRKLAEVESNPCSVFCLAANDDTLFSCSNEGTIKTFELDTLKPKSELIRDENVEFWRLAYSNGYLFSGDSEGNVKVWKDGAKLYGKLNIAEPVKDMVVHNHMVFTVKDLDLVITDVKVATEKLQFGTKNSFMGRAPVTLIGDNLLAFSTREGMGILIHENNADAKFKEVTKIENAHEKIINALAGAKWNEKNILFSGGWDKLLKEWIIEGTAAKPIATCDTEIVISAITTGGKGELYIGGENGILIRIKVD